MLSISCINRMSYLSTITAYFRSISSFITFFASNNHWIDHKKFGSLVV